MHHANDKKNLIDLSYYIGKQFNLVQGAGGNTSYKDFEHDQMLIKASGKCLANTKQEDIFVTISLSDIVRCANEQGENFSDYIISKNSLRPSIETGFHALLPQRFVAHVHSINALSYLCQKNSTALLKNLLKGICYQFIPYARPGLPLTEEIKSAIISSNINKDQTWVLTLENHGLIVAANTAAKLIDTLKKVEILLHAPIRKPTKPDITVLQQYADKLDMKIPKPIDVVSSLGTDIISLAAAKLGPLYPDHIVFLGEDAIYTDKNLEQIKLYKAKPPSYLIIEKLGVLINKDLNQQAQDMLHCWAEVLLRVSDPCNLKPLTAQEKHALTNWEAEKYRIALAK